MHLEKLLAYFMASAALLGSPTASATSVSVVGLFKDKAIVSIDGG